MVKKTREEKKAERKHRFLFLMMLITATSMLFSGVYYINIGRGQAPVKNSLAGKLAMIEQYNLKPAVNGSVLAQVGEGKDELLIIPGVRCMDIDNIIELRNSSIDGVESISCEVANPRIDIQRSIICGTFILFRLRFDLNDSGINDRVRRRLSNVLSKYNRMRGYTIKLQEDTLGSRRVYVIGSEETKEGDYVRVALFNRDLIAGGTGLLGIEERIVPKGPHFSARVVNITGISVSGAIPGEFNREEIVNSLGLNESELNSRMPEFRVNGSLSKEDIELIHAGIQEVGNTTIIKFNGSGEKIKDILAEEGLSYFLKPGAVFFRVGLNSSVQRIEEVLTENGVVNTTFQKAGRISMPEEIIINGRLVPIENHDAFEALFYMDTEIGDRINISLNTISLGDRITPFGASEFRNETESIMR